MAAHDLADDRQPEPGALPLLLYGRDRVDDAAGRADDRLWCRGGRLGRVQSFAEDASHVGGVGRVGVGGHGEAGRVLGHLMAAVDDGAQSGVLLRVGGRSVISGPAGRPNNGKRVFENTSYVMNSSLNPAFGA